MTLSVIGAGYGRTGTLSLKAALERLGYMKCHHMIEVINLKQRAPPAAGPRRASSSRPEDDLLTAS